MIGYFRQVKATIVFKHNVDSLNRVDEEYEDHWEFEAGGEIELKPKAKAEVGKEGVKAGVGVGGPKGTGKVRHDNKNKHIKNRNFKKGDEGEISELAFETGVPELGKINRWKSNDLGLEFERRYDGDCQYAITIKMP